MATFDRSRAAAAPVFADLDAAALDAVLSCARPQPLSKGDGVFNQGDIAQDFFLLLEGRLRVTRLTPQGRQMIVRFLGPGEIFGVAAAIKSETYPGSAAAVTDALILRWPNAAWSQIAARAPTVVARTLEMFGARVQDLQSRLLEMAGGTTEARLARALLTLGDQAGRETEEGLLIDFPITRQDLAEMIGATLHTVSRILSAWETKNFIRGGRRRVAIRDAQSLSRIAEAIRD